jgi:hypothetical protein
MHQNNRTLQKQVKTEALRDWDYLAGPPPAAAETPPLKDEPTVAGRVREVNEQAIRELAYSRWEAAGRPEGDGVRFWLEAEQELKSRGG